MDSTMALLGAPLPSVPEFDASDDSEDEVFIGLNKSDKEKNGKNSKFNNRQTLNPNEIPRRSINKPNNKALQEVDLNVSDVSVSCFDNTHDEMLLYEKFGENYDQIVADMTNKERKLLKQELLSSGKVDQNKKQDQSMPSINEHEEESASNDLHLASNDLNPTSSNEELTSSNDHQVNTNEDQYSASNDQYSASNDPHVTSTSFENVLPNTPTIVEPRNKKNSPRMIEPDEEVLQSLKHHKIEHRH